MRKLWDSAAEDAGRRGKAAAQPGGAAAVRGCRGCPWGQRGGAKGACGVGQGRHVRGKALC